MPFPDYRTAAAAYQQAISRLYEGAGAARADRGPGGLQPAPDLPARAQAVIDHSAELGGAAAGVMRAAASADQYELARLQLLAAAAVDLTVAHDLAAEAEGPGGERAAERGAGIPADLQAILNTPPEAGIRALLPGASLERGTARPSNPRAARDALQKAVNVALEDICDDAARAGQAALAGLLQIPAPPLADAGRVALHELTAWAGQGLSALLAKAVSLVLRAVEKIFAALGQEGQGWIRQKAVEWVEDLEKGTLFGKLLEGLYELEKIQAEVDQRIRAAPEGLGANVFNAASEQVERLAAQFGKQRQVIEWVARGLAWVRPWVLGLPPWGPLALTGSYVTLIGYAVCAGGDYVDWYRTGDRRWLDLVPGIRGVVRAALADLPPPVEEPDEDDEEEDEEEMDDGEFDEPGGR
jgi:hypothetical protein